MSKINKRDFEYLKKKDHDKFHEVAAAKHKHAANILNKQRYRDCYNLYELDEDTMEKIYKGKKQKTNRPSYLHPKHYKELDRLEEIRKEQIKY